MNIGIFTYDFFPIFGGQGRHVYELYKQNQQNKKANIYIFSPATNDLENHIRLFPETKQSRFKNIEYSFKLNNTIDKIIEAYNLDIVHIHGGPGGIFLLKKLKVPVVYTVHHTYWQQYRYIQSQRWKYFFYLLEKRSYQLADKIICVSNDTLQILKNNYQLKNRDLVYIPNGIEKIKKNTKITKSKNILYVGRIDKRKGVDFLIRSMKLVNAANKDIVLHVVGTGKDLETLKQMSKQEGLSVIFHGHISDEELEKLYKYVSIQIVPSLFEGFGISVLEGMSEGKPIIATNVDGIKGIIKDNYSGLLVEYGNEQELANTILDLLKDASLQKKLATNAYKELAKYDWKEVYLKTISTYEKLV